MSFWTNINGHIILEVFSSSPDNGFTNYKKAEEFIKQYLGPYQTYYNNVDYNDVKLPIGSEGSITYHITDMTDYSIFNHKRKQNHITELNKRFFTMGIIFNGNLRDFWNDKKLLDWVNSLQNIFPFHLEIRVVIKDGLFNIESPDNSYILKYNYLDMNWETTLNKNN